MVMERYAIQTQTGGHMHHNPRYKAVSEKRRSLRRNRIQPPARKASAAGANTAYHPGLNERPTKPFHTAAVMIITPMMTLGMTGEYLTRIERVSTLVVGQIRSHPGGSTACGS